MAKGGKDEHRMLFDLQGKRRNVVKVVYAVLAVLMGLSLMLVIGPAPLADIFGTNDEASRAAEQFEEQAERIEVKLAKDPEDPALLQGLMRAQVNAANQLVDFDEGTEQRTFTIEARQEMENASATWSEYLEATDEPSAGAALLIVPGLIVLAETARTAAEAVGNVGAAAEAQKIVAEQRPSVNSLSTLALYTLFTERYAEAERFKEEAEDLAISKVQREQIQNRFNATKERSVEFHKQLDEAEKQAKKASEEAPPGATTPEGGAPVNPFGNSLGGGSTLSE